MAIWSREHKETRTYFNLDTALIKDRDSKLTLKLFGITISRNKENFGAEVIEGKKGVGFNSK
jgi:hypothetical protein